MRSCFQTTEEFSHTGGHSLHILRHSASPPSWLPALLVLRNPAPHSRIHGHRGWVWAPSWLPVALQVWQVTHRGQEQIWFQCSVSEEKDKNSINIWGRTGLLLGNKKTEANGRPYLPYSFTIGRQEKVPVYKMKIVPEQMCGRRNNLQSENWRRPCFV